jgi:hypothetical protein
MSAGFVMPRTTRATLGALAPIVCTDEVTELGLGDAVVDHVALMLRTFPPHLRIMLLVGAFFFEWLPLFLPSSRLRPFSRLPRALKEAWFRRFWDSHIFVVRQLAKGMKSLVALAFWDQRQVLDRLEYHPERWIAEVAARRLRDYADDIRAHDRFVLQPNPLPLRALSSSSNGAHTATAPAVENKPEEEQIVPLSVRRSSHGPA